MENIEIKPLLSPIKQTYFERSVTEIKKQLTDDFFVAVTGQSGSGKSTFINETLARVLANEFYKELPWRIVQTMPFGDPIGNLATDLTKVPTNEDLRRNSLYPSGVIEASFRDKTENLLRENNSTLINMYNDEVVRSNAPFNLLLIVDQAQELFRYSKYLENEGDDVRYVDLLLKAKNSSVPIYIIFISDSLYIDSFSKYRGLPESINRYRYSVPEIKIDDKILASFFPKEDAQNPDHLRDQLLKEQMLKDFKDISSSDPNAIQKLNLVLSHFMPQWGKEAVLGKSTPLDLYKKAGGIKEAISYFAENEVYSKMENEQKKDCEFLFQALTEKGVRRPVKLGDLQAITRRAPGEAKISLAEIETILNKFNTSGEKFIRFTGSTDLSPKTIVDINFDSLLKWPKLDSWINFEMNNANVYRNLVREALTQFNEKNEAPKLKLYEGAVLSSAINWEKYCHPNEDWAIRYLPLLPEENEEHLQKIRIGFPELSTGKLTNLSIAKAFLNASRKAAEYNDQQKERNIKVAERLKKRAFQWTAVAVTAGIIAAVFGYNAYLERRKMEFIGLVNVLDRNSILDGPTSQWFDRLNKVIDDVVQSKTINSEVKVLNFLKKNSMLWVNNTDSVYAFRSLLNINQLFQETANGKTHQASLQDLDSIYAQWTRVGLNNQQYPYLYYAIQAQLRELGKTTPSGASNALIERSALVTNPQIKESYAYGDKNGYVFLNDSETRFDDVHRVIKTLGFSFDGARLYVGTELGDICYYNNVNIPGGKIAQQKIFTDPSKKSIFFIGEVQGTNLLLVSNTYEAYVLKLTNGRSLYERFGTVTLPQERVTSRTWSIDQQWFIAGGKDQTVIYRFDPNNKTEPLRERHTITHPGITVMDVAIRMDSMTQETWMALGSETGDIWIAASKGISILTNNQELNDTTTFTLYTNVHESAIISLQFNPDLQRQQLASASMDGSVQLWNLTTRTEPYDHIWLRNLGQGITSMVYINPDEILAFENINQWHIKTNVKALKEDLDCMMKYKGKCNK